MWCPIHLPLFRWLCWADLEWAIFHFAQFESFKKIVCPKLTIPSIQYQSSTTEILTYVPSEMTLNGGGGCLNINTSSYQHRDSHVKDKAVFNMGIFTHTWGRRQLYVDGARILTPPYFIWLAYQQNIPLSLLLLNKTISLVIICHLG